MKLTIIAFGLITLIYMHSVTSIMKVNKKVKKTKKSTSKAEASTKGDYGSGSWDGGYDCPDIKVALGKGGLQTLGRGRFWAPKLQNPVTQSERLGWTFKMDSPPKGDLMRLMVKGESANYWFLPFRKISSTATYVNPSGYKYIQIWITDDDKKNYRFRVNLPWAYLGWYINDTEGRKICNFLNTQRTQAVSEVSKLKADINTAANEYMTNFDLYQNASKSGSNIANQEKAMKDKLETLKKALDNTQVQFDNAKKSADTLQSSATASKLELDKIDSAITAAVNERAVKQETLKALQGKDSKSAEAISKLKTDVDKANNVFDSEMKILRTEAPSKENKIKAAEESNKGLDTTGVKTNLGGIAP